MSNNKFGRFRIIAPSLLALNFLVIGQVRGPVLSRNRVGSGNSTTRELAVTSSSSSFFANAHRYFQRRRCWSSCHLQLPAQQECRRRDINDKQQLWYVSHCHCVLLALNFLITILGQVRGPVLSHNWVGSGNTTRELTVISSSSLLFSQPTRKLYFRRRNRWSSWRRQLPTQQECRDINVQQQLWYVPYHYVPAGPQLSHYR